MIDPNFKPSDIQVFVRRTEVIKPNSFVRVEGLIILLFLIVLKFTL